MDMKTTGEKFYESGYGEDAEYANPKILKAEGDLYIYGGNINIYTENDGGEGLESKNGVYILGGYIIIDAREQDEYDEGHIPGAILIPYGEIADRAEKELPDKDQLILVYCRSGRRSKIAAEELVKLSYTNVKEFGGIIDWEYEIVK